MWTVPYVTSPCFPLTRQSHHHLSLLFSRLKLHLFCRSFQQQAFLRPFLYGLLLGLLTALAGSVKRLVTFVRFHSVSSNQPTFNVHYAAHHFLAKKRVCHAHEHLLRHPVSTGRRSRFPRWRHRLRASAAEAMQRCVCLGNAVGRSDLDPKSVGGFLSKSVSVVSVLFLVSFCSRRGTQSGSWGAVVPCAQLFRHRLFAVVFSLHVNHSIHSFIHIRLLVQQLTKRNFAIELK